MLLTYLETAKTNPKGWLTMTTTAERTVADLVREKPGRSRIFERYGIDFCCGGKRTLEDACVMHGISTQELVEALLNLDTSTDSAGFDTMPLPDLMEHIVATHHNPLRTELPRLTAMARRVAAVHGDRDERLESLAAAVQDLETEMMSHTDQEEQVVFPEIRRKAEGHVHEAPGGPLAGLIEELESDHQEAGDALRRIRELSDNYTPPDWACNTYRALLDGLREFELDLHNHVHKENYILFPKALALP